MTDWVFMVKHSSYMYITGPAVIQSVTGEKTTHEDLGGAVSHNTKSGNAHFACEDEGDAVEKVKKLLSFLPDNNMSDPPRIQSTDSTTRTCPEMGAIIPDDPRKGISPVRTRAMQWRR
jgi:acetyl-CoA carboxylase carboxyltransferase component